MELCLGTVQFGMDYGVRGQKRPDLERCAEMLDYATQNGIDTIDTANAYGEAESVIGYFIKKKNIERNKIKIISKVRPNILDDVDQKDYYTVIKNNFEQTASRMGVDYLDGYLFHSARYVYNDVMLHALKEMKKEGYVNKIGVSVYEPVEAREGIMRANLDLIQIPFSIFDQRMKKEGVFAVTENAKKEIHARSAFIQGLIQMNENEIPDFLQKARPIVTRMNKICKEYQLNRTQLALQYVKQHTAIKKLVFGVDNLEQLKRDIIYFNTDISPKFLAEIETEFYDIPTDIVMPSLWNRKA